MPTVKFTALLKRFYPNLDAMQVSGATVAEVLEGLEAQHKGIKNYIVDEQGQLRKHVNIFVNGQMVHDRKTLSDAVNESSEVYVIQALSGG